MEQSKYKKKKKKKTWDFWNLGLFPKKTHYSQIERVREFEQN